MAALVLMEARRSNMSVAHAPCLLTLHTPLERNSWNDFFLFEIKSHKTWQLNFLHMWDTDNIGFQLYCQKHGESWMSSFCSFPTYVVPFRAVWCRTYQWRVLHHHKQFGGRMIGLVTSIFCPWAIIDSSLAGRTGYCYKDSLRTGYWYTAFCYISKQLKNRILLYCFLIYF